MIYWGVVEIIYIANALIFGFLSAVFWQKYRNANDGKTVLIPVSILLTVLFLQELYFAINTASDPNKLGFLFPAAFQTINSAWIYMKALVTLAGLGIVYTVFKFRE